MIEKPRGLPYLCVAIGGHAFAWYSVYNVYALYLVELGLGEDAAKGRFASFVGWAYIAVLLGGFMSSGGFGWRGLGPRRTALLGAAVACAGYAAMWAGAATGFALAPLLLGCGMLKPTLSAMVGTIYPSGSPAADRAYGSYYSALNLGATGAPILAGLVMGHVVGVAGYRACFGYAVVGDAIVVLSLLVGWRALAPAERRSSVAAALGVADEGFLPDEPEPAQARRRLLALAVVLALAAVSFWPAYLQNGSGQTLWAQSHTDRSVSSFWLQFVLGDEVGAPMFSAINTVLCVAATPFLIAWITRAGLRLSRVLFLGYGLMAASFAVLAAAPQQGKASPAWLVASIVLGSLSEIAVSTYGLIQVNKLTPRRYVPLCMSAWYVTVAAGSWISGVLAAATAGQQPRVPFAVLAAAAGAGAAIGLLFGRILDVDVLAPGRAVEARSEAPRPEDRAEAEGPLPARLDGLATVSS